MLRPVLAQGSPKTPATKVRQVAQSPRTPTRANKSPGMDSSVTWAKSPAKHHSATRMASTRLSEKFHTPTSAVENGPSGQFYSAARAGPYPHVVPQQVLYNPNSGLPVYQYDSYRMVPHFQAENVQLGPQPSYNPYYHHVPMYDPKQVALAHGSAYQGFSDMAMMNLGPSPLGSNAVNLPFTYSTPMMPHHMPTQYPVTPAYTPGAANSPKLRQGPGHMVVPVSPPETPNSPTHTKQVQSPDVKGTNVYIRGLPPETTDESLHHMCERWGRISSSKAMIDSASDTCKGFGFANFETENEAANCIRGLTQYGFQESFSSRLKQLQDDSSTNLYVSNIPLELDEKKLEEVFSPYPVLSNRILRNPDGTSRGVGFARMVDRESAEAVIETLNNVSISEDQEPLQVRYADSTSQKRLKQQTAKRRQYRAQEYSALTSNSLETGSLSPAMYSVFPQAQTEGRVPSASPVSPYYAYHYPPTQPALQQKWPHAHFSHSPNISVPHYMSHQRMEGARDVNRSADGHWREHEGDAASSQSYLQPQSIAEPSPLLRVSH